MTVNKTEELSDSFDTKPLVMRCDHVLLMRLVFTC